MLFPRDVVMRFGILDLACRQRAAHRVAPRPGGVCFPFMPGAAPGIAARLPPDTGFGCPGGPDMLKIEPIGADEILFPLAGTCPPPLQSCRSTSQ
jgi:hypothetical protein